MHHQLSAVQAAVGYHVDAHTAKADAAYKDGKVLLFGAERGRWYGAHDHNGRPLGGKRQPPQ